MLGVAVNLAARQGQNANSHLLGGTAVPQELASSCYQTAPLTPANRAFLRACSDQTWHSRTVRHGQPLHTDLRDCNAIRLRVGSICARPLADRQQPCMRYSCNAFSTSLRLPTYRGRNFADDILSQQPWQQATGSRH